MRLRIHHHTLYRYDGVVNDAVQIARLTPRASNDLKINYWRVRGEDSKRSLIETTDGYGNILHIHSLGRLGQSSAIHVEGEVETSDTKGVAGKGPGSLPPSFFLRHTKLTNPTMALVSMAEEVPFGPNLERLHLLMGLVRERVEYRAGATDVATTADEALSRCAGVCQDHAHIFVTCSRILGIPSRYVSGYLWTGPSSQEDASHAWAESWIDELGWVGFDPANLVCPGEAYVRTAIALDYWSAAPIRGIWRGTGQEQLDVTVQVHEQQTQQ